MSDWTDDAPIIPLDREQWGIVIDALIEHAASAAARKHVNPESTSDVRVTMCNDLISLLNGRLGSSGSPRG